MRKKFLFVIFFDIGYNVGVKKFRKWFPRISMPIGFFAVVFGFMLLSVGFCVYNRGFYDRQFRKHDVLSNIPIEQSELDRVRDRMIDYFAGRVDCLQVYVLFIGETEPRKFFTDEYDGDGEQNEISHMADVKVLFDLARVGGWSFLTGGTALIAASVALSKKGEKLRRAAKGAVIGAGSFFGTLAVLGLSILIMGFSRAFDIFHHLFFPQGNWQFGPNSYMIRVLPEGLFLDAGIIIILSGMALAAVLLVAGIVVNKAKNKNKTPKRSGRIKESL
jgi:integral membrane protein (TIGR01906 family)